MSIIIEPVRPGDAESVYRLLEAQHLPLDGLADHLRTAVVARDGESIVGSAALEIYGSDALLRSVAVADAYQGQHIGRDLTNAALQLAKRRAVSTVFLLTDTAEQYFPKFGFERVTREDVPVAVRRSVEFTAACPESATVMRKTL